MTTTDSSNNQVFLRGVLGADVVHRELPSGDPLASFRLTVPRPAGSRVRVDSIDCAASSARVRRTLTRAVPGDEVEVTGSLRRRFWRGPAGLASRYEVEVVSARLIARRRNDAAPSRKPASG
jgi:single-strand DNA-binding protein